MNFIFINQLITVIYLLYVIAFFFIFSQDYFSFFLFREAVFSCYDFWLKISFMNRKIEIENVSDFEWFFSFILLHHLEISKHKIVQQTVCRPSKLIKKKNKEFLKFHYRKSVKKTQKRTELRKSTKLQILSELRSFFWNSVVK